MNIWVWGNVLDDLSMNEGHGCGIHEQKFACLHDKARTTHCITTKHGSFVALVMVITWLNFLENCYFGKFSLKILDVFLQGQTLFGHISEMVGPIDVKRKGSALFGYWVQYMTLTFDLTHDPNLGCFKVKFLNSSISRIVGLINVKWKASELIIWYWADCLTLPFDHTHDLDLGISRSESDIALSQEWGSRLTMNEKDVSHPFMAMILTCITMVGWADVPNSDRGDFRRRRAVDISSLHYITMPDL